MPVVDGVVLGGGLLTGAGGRRGAVAGRDEGDLVAEPGQGLLVVADEVLAVAAVPLLVVVLAGLGVVLAAAEDSPGDADQGAGDRDRGFLLVALAEPAGQAAEPGTGPGPGPGGRPGRTATQTTFLCTSAPATRG